jgi:hypothetical protein
MLTSGIPLGSQMEATLVVNYQRNAPRSKHSTPVKYSQNLTMIESAALHTAGLGLASEM